MNLDTELFGFVPLGSGFKLHVGLGEKIRCQVRFKIGPREVDANLWDLQMKNLFIGYGRIVNTVVMIPILAVSA